MIKVIKSFGVAESPPKLKIFICNLNFNDKNNEFIQPQQSHHHVRRQQHEWFHFHQW